MRVHVCGEAVAASVCVCPFICIDVYKFACILSEFVCICAMFVWMFICVCVCVSACGCTCVSGALTSFPTGRKVPVSLEKRDRQAGSQKTEDGEKERQGAAE